MTKERFVERYGVPRYTVGVGGSGGAIQQYVYGQNHRGLLDAAIPVVSYPDMTTQTIHVGDCELLEHYMDVTDAANPKWRNWDNREWLIGLNGNAAFPNPYTGRPGSDECVNGWRGLTPLALNPLFGTAGAGTERMNPAVMAQVKWTHWEDARNVYGVRAGRLGPLAVGQRRRPVRPQGARRRPHHARRVPRPQRRRRDLEGAGGHGPGGPAVPAHRRLRPVERAQHAPRTAAPPGAAAATSSPCATPTRRACTSTATSTSRSSTCGRTSRRPLDMHNSHQSFASRQRMLDKDGHAANQAIWFWGPEGGDRADAPAGLHRHRRVAGQPGAPPLARRRRQPPGGGRGRVLHRHRRDDRRRRRRLGRHPRPPRARAVHARLPDPLDVADRRRRPAARRRLQVRAAAGGEGARARALRRLAPERGRARAARADLPDRRVRLHATRTWGAPSSSSSATSSS